MQRIRPLVVLAIALAAAFVIAACGGSSGGDEDPQEVLDATFTNEEKISSGAFDVSIEVKSEGGSDPGEFKASLGGPFESVENGFPKFDVDAEVEVNSSQDFSGSAGLTSTGDQAFVDFQGSDYEVPQQLFSQFATQFTQLQQQSESQSQDEGNFLAQVGVNPSNWLTDLDNDGSEDVEGTETIHISGQADVPKLVEDIKKIAENVPQAAQQVTPEQLSELDQLTGLVESANFDIYTGKDDDILRKLSAELTLNPPEGTTGSPDSVDLNFSITLKDLNDPQTISAPSGAQPLGDLLQQFGVDPDSLGQLGGALGGAGDGAAVPQAGGSPNAPSGGASQA
ncbi:MAG: hypothetical protein M3M99_03865, partial [Actinomycetota bacterium]|nr:hypothetical protein [Actinomycetota bacterium]